MSGLAPSKVRVLLVEDSPLDARIVERLLRATPEASFDVTWVPLLREALQRLRKETFDVILLDLLLPDSYGLDTLDKVVATRPGLPIVVMTGADDVNFALEAVRRGAHDYLLKGQVHGDLLVRSLRYAVDRHGGKPGGKPGDGEAPFRSVLEASADPLMVADDGGRVLYANPACARLFGRSGEALVGQTIQLPKSSQPVAVMRLVLASGERVPVMVRPSRTRWGDRDAFLLWLHHAPPPTSSRR